jgi:decaprenylphospho-beta-D-erythro-pentofuranosid-2-ulose 2-reductase
MHSKKIVIIGATSWIAENCARLWVAEEPTLELVLVGRNLEKLERIATDLKVRNPKSTINCITTNFTDPKEIEGSVKKITDQGKVDIVLIAHGALPDQNRCQNDILYCTENLQINAISPVLFAECFLRSKGINNHGTLAIIGSVAGDRGRKSNYVYGSAKAMVEKYFEGLQHRFYKTKINIVLIKPGPTETPMTKGLKNVKTTPVKIVSQNIVNAIKKGTPNAYAPRKWLIIMTIIKLLPNFIFNKLDI